jgi:hypothetical protein
MHELLPEGEEIRRAIKWVSMHLQENPAQPVQLLVHKAVFTFDLSPKDAEFLIRFYQTLN